MYGRVGVEDKDKEEARRGHHQQEARKPASQLAFNFWWFYWMTGGWFFWWSVVDEVRFPLDGMGWDGTRDVSSNNTVHD